MTAPALTRIELTNFTAFSSLDLELSPQLNVFVGVNGAGKTHLLKVLYAAAAAMRKDTLFAQKLVGVFRPFEDRLGRLARRVGRSTTSTVKARRNRARLSLEFTNHTKDAADLRAQVNDWKDDSLRSIYVPVKEVLAHARGLRPLVREFDLRFDDTHLDLMDWAEKPLRRGAPDAFRRGLLGQLENHLQGTVLVEEGEFFLKDRLGKLEFTLLAEGHRKLALVWQLIQNGTLPDSSALFWDEPEANLNPRVIGDLVGILLQLVRHGAQVFVATHDYVFLKELELQRQKDDLVSFHALARAIDGVNVRTSPSLATVEPNAVRETFVDLLDREVAKGFED